MNPEPAAAGSHRPHPFPRFAVTSGEPAGVGPELVVRLAATPFAADLVAIGDASLLASAAHHCGAALKIEPYDGEFDGLVTAPVQKSVINDAGEPFTGHTELFAQRAGCDVVMMLASPELRVALATTHLPLASVPAAITRESLTRTLHIVHSELIAKFGIAEPRIAVLGLN